MAFVSNVLVALACVPTAIPGSRASSAFRDFFLLDALLADSASF
jgi:hypothetical protein